MAGVLFGLVVSCLSSTFYRQMGSPYASLVVGRIPTSPLLSPACLPIFSRLKISVSLRSLVLSLSSS
ncbi:hypothetical protein GIB67_013192, partial [Kingdonia uniflora]